MPWSRSAKIAFIGSHSVRKSNAVHAFASTIGRAGRSVEVGREVVRFNPLGLNDVELQADGVRSTNDAFRDQIEAILDRILPIYLPAERAVRVHASSVTAEFDWWSIGERLAAIVGEPLVDGQLSAPLG